MQFITNLLRKVFTLIPFLLSIGVLLTSLLSCSSTNPKDTRVSVRIPTETWWTNATHSSDLSTKNFANARQEMNQNIPFKYLLGFNQDLQINAFAAIYNQQPIVVFTQGFINEFGHDPDVIATTLGHELAHHQLGHTKPSYKNDRATAQEVTSQILGTVANIFIPFSGLLVSPAVKVVGLSFSREDERQADQLGMKWAMQAGYSPCGSYRFSKRMEELGKSRGLDFFSTHPGNEERAENALAFMRLYDKNCGQQ